MLLLVSEIVLNEALINVNKNEEEKVDHLHKISVKFNVTSEEYLPIQIYILKGRLESLS
jgi:hypothetical protein